MYNLLYECGFSKLFLIDRSKRTLVFWSPSIIYQSLYFTEMNMLYIRYIFPTFDSVFRVGYRKL